MLALASDDEAVRARAFATVAELYWRPLYKYARLAHARAPLEAEDLTQNFLTRLLEKEALASYDASRGGFRPFLRMLFDRHVANEVKAAYRLKRGGAAAQADFAAAEGEIGAEEGRVRTPEEVFQSDWARAVFALALERLRDEIRADDFALFEAYDLDDAARPSYRELADRFALPVTTVTNRLASARRRFREAVLDILREATTSEREYRAEVRALLGVEA